MPRLDSRGREVESDHVDRALWPRADGLTACTDHLCACKPRAEIRNPHIPSGDENPARHGLAS